MQSAPEPLLELVPPEEEPPEEEPPEEVPPPDELVESAVLHHSPDQPVLQTQSPSTQ